jgi:hypothetical protein
VAPPSIQGRFRANKGSDAEFQTAICVVAAEPAAAAARCGRHGGIAPANRCRLDDVTLDRGTNMSLTAITTSTSTALPGVNFHPRGHRKGAHVDTGSSTSSSNASGIGQLPVGAATPLFSNLLQSLEQTVSAQSAVTAAGSVGATGTASAAGSTPAAAGAPASAATPAQQQELQAFLHSLFQALKQDGLGTSNGAAATPSAAGATGSATTATPASGQYQANLVSSLQSLMQQVGPDGKATAATETLTSTFQNLVNGLMGPAAASSGSSNTGSNQSPNAGLQNFLGNLLQNLQTNGVHTLTGVGNNVNANI